MSNTTRDRADADFDRDVPEKIREDVYQEMSDSVAEGVGRGRVTILEHDRIDAVNARASGIVSIDGREFHFEMEDGNNAGTVLRSWGAEERPFERHVPTRWAVQPTGEAVQRAIDAGREALLLAKWDAISSRPDVADMVRAYGYDRHFAPGVVTETHWRGKAAHMGLVIVDEEMAADTRRMLAGAGRG